jgi:hypothetical protein
MSGKKDEHSYVRIGGGYVIDLKNMIQFQENDPTK